MIDSFGNGAAHLGVGFRLLKRLTWRWTIAPMRRLAWLLLCVVSPLFAQEADAIRAERLAPGETLRMDGTLAHPAWQRAPVHERFIEKDPVNGAAPLQATQVQVVFDERALYVGVTALDTEPERIRKPIVRADNVNRTQDFGVV